LFREAREARTSKSYWRRVGELQKIGTREVFDTAARAMTSDLAARRRLGAAVLGELGYMSSTPPFKSESVPRLLNLLSHESDPSVKAAAITALGRLRAREAIPELVSLAGDESDAVRLQLARELVGCTWDSGEERPDPSVTATLIRLSSDHVAAIRDWACFSLASSEADTPEIRAALWRRVKDRHYDTRIEALRGLARRRDDKVREELREAVMAIGPHRLGSWVVDDLVDFASSVGDRTLVDVLAS
jgi:HEAT repeat protein